MNRISWLSMFIVGLAIAGVGRCQTSAPLVQRIDQNGVDVVNKTINVAIRDISIGPNDPHGMSFSRTIIQGFQYSNLDVTLSGSSAQLFLDVGARSQVFTLSGSTYTPNDGDGATLVSSAGRYTYTGTDGTVIKFIQSSDSTCMAVCSNIAYVDSITFPDGTKWTYYYKTVLFSANSSSTTYSTYRRVQSIVNNFGYEIKLNYQFNDTDGHIYLSNSLSTNSSWTRVASVVAFNNTVQYCAPTSDVCNLTGSWPSVSFGYTQDNTGYAKVNMTSVTNSAGQSWTYTYGGYSNLGLSNIRRAGESLDDIAVTYSGGSAGSAGQPTLVTRRGVSWTYSFDQTGIRSGLTTTVVQDPYGASHRRYYSYNANRQIESDINENGSETKYLYDASGRIVRYTQPEGDRAEYEYDNGLAGGRGNLTKITQYSKDGAATLVTRATFPASCSGTDQLSGETVTPQNCNKPTSVTDARQNVSHFKWFANGLLEWVKAPPNASGVRAETHYSYGSQAAWTLLGQGGYSQLPDQVTLLQEVRACRTAAWPCSTSDQVLTSFSYDPGSATQPTNLGLRQLATSAGDGSQSSTKLITHDAIGNIVTVDGPLPGPADTTRIAYKPSRQVSEITGPDPDGTGPLRNRAIWWDYAPNGEVTSLKVGTANADGSSFSELQRLDTGYDSAGRPTQVSLLANGVTYSLTQYSYDPLGRLDCSTVRMTSSTFGSLPGACTLSGSATIDADRITRTEYDPAGQMIKVWRGYGTQNAVSSSWTYWPNGTVKTALDEQGNLTSYTYDQFDRLYTTSYPSTSVGAASSGSSFEQLGYDANGNPTSVRLRDGNTYSPVYDGLNRMTSDGLGHTFAYDLLGRLVSANDANNAYETITYNPSGQKTSESAAHGGMATMENDAAGRRTKLTWADGFYVTYEYDTVGEVTAIRENGGLALATFTYDDLGRRTKLTRSNGTSSNYNFGSGPGMDSLTLNGGAANTLSFTYNAAGQIISRTSSNDAYVWNSASNIYRSYTPNGLNQYTQWGSVIPSYDGRGNLTQGGNVAQGATVTYSYNLLNQLTGFTGDTIYRNALGRWLDVSSEQRWMVYDADRTIEEYGYDGTVKRRYVYGPDGDEPLVWYEGSTTADRRFLHADERGSIISVTNTSGGLLAINTYDEYGIPGQNNLGRFQYTGQRWIPSLGLYDFKARMYSPTIGRFIQPDPIGYGDGLNLYQYAHGDPINVTDPSGLAGNCGSSTNPCPLPPVTVNPGGSSGGGGSVSNNPFQLVTGVLAAVGKVFGLFSHKKNDHLEVPNTPFIVVNGRYVLNNDYDGGPLAPYMDACAVLCGPVIAAGGAVGAVGFTEVAVAEATITDAAVADVAVSQGVAMTPNAAGKAGEAAVRAIYDIGPKEFIKVGGRFRVPDGITKTALSEIKNVAKLAYTRQLRDYAAYAHATGRVFKLYVREGAELSGPLKAAIANEEIILIPFTIP